MHRGVGVERSASNALASRAHQLGALESSPEPTGARRPEFWKRWRVEPQRVDQEPEETQQHE